MPFSQLHYTSSETGLSGHSGFQFCAMTPGVPPEVMREIEKLTVYEQPRHTRDAGLDPDRFPTNLLYTYSETTGLTIIARVRFAGLDFSNRPGNYFAHSLVTSTPDDDLQAVLPAELWDAPFWDSGQSPVSELPVLVSPLLRGPISRDRISRFLTASPESGEFLPALLTAADEAMNGNNRILLVGPDSAAVCHWIAAISYLLGPQLARYLTFSTYSHDPRRCPTQIVGTVAAAGPFRSDMVASYRFFDLEEGPPADLRPSAAATLLARTGIDASVGLWDLASSLGAPAEPSLSGWFPILACAALILGHQLTADELEPAIDWLASTSTRHDSRLASAVRAALNHPVGRLTAVRQQQLVQLGHRADRQLGDTDSALAKAVECAIVMSVLGEMEHGRPPGNGFPLQTQGAVGMASDGCSRVLGSCDTDVAISLLAWASVSGAQPDPQAVERIGRAVVRDEVRGNRTPPPGLADAAAAWPALRAGMMEELASLPTPAQEAVLNGTVSGVLRRADFTRHAALYEKWLITFVRNGRLTPVAAMTEIMELRRGSGRYAAPDESLLARVWPDRDWTFAEAAELLNCLRPAELSGRPVTSRLESLLEVVPREEDLPGWIAFVTALASHLRSHTWPGDQLKLAIELSRVAELMDATTRQEQAVTDRAVDELVGLYAACAPGTRRFLDYHLPPLLLYYSRLAPILQRCPAQLLREFCAYARYPLLQDRGSGPAIFIAARVFVATRDFRDRKFHDSAIYLEENILRPTLPHWRKSEINIAADEADKILRHGGRLLLDWYGRNSKQNRISRLLGFE